MYTIHLTIQGHLENMDLLFFFFFLSLSSDWSIQTPADRWGMGGEGGG